MTPSKKVLKKHRQSLRTLISRRQSSVPITQLIETINLRQRGWANYFSFGYPRKAMRTTNWYLQGRLIGHLRQRSQRPFRPPKGRSYYRHPEQLGLIYL